MLYRIKTRPAKTSLYEFAQSIQACLAKYPRNAEGYPETMDFVKQFSWENRIERILSYVDEKVRYPIIQNSVGAGFTNNYRLK